MEEMKYAPILIPTMCRADHFIRLMESLKKNTWAKYTDVYIGLDYPPSEKYIEGYERICCYLEGDFSEFASINVIRQEQNQGSGQNMACLIKLVFKKYDRFIRTDDDAEFSPNFIEYIDKCLMKYEDDDKIIAVTGYNYPVKFKVSEEATIYKQNFICPMWGVGFWKLKFGKSCKELLDGCLKETIPFVIKNNLLDKMLITAKCEYIDLCLSPLFKDSLASAFTDISLRMYTVIYDKYVISPVVSKVRNWGFDGSGIFCRNITVKNEKEQKINARNYRYNEQPIDISNEFEIKEDAYNLLDYNRKLLEKFEDIPLKRILKVRIKLLLYRILGERLFYKIMRYKV